MANGLLSASLIQASISSQQANHPIPPIDPTATHVNVDSPT